jgi:hypothetical protein
VKISYKISYRNILFCERVSRMAAWAQWVRSPTLTDVESAQHSQRAVRSSPQAGSDLSGGEVDRRLLTWSHNGDLRHRMHPWIIWFFVFFFVVHFYDTHPPVSAPMHVGVRSTWLNSEALSCDKDIFFEKKKIKLFDTANSRIYVLESMDAFVVGRKFYFWKKENSWEKILEKNSEKNS